MNWLFVVNDGAVGLFGAFLSAGFCNIVWNKRNKTIFAAVVGGLGILQALLFTAFGADKLRLWYPLITHLPLALLLMVLSGKRLWSVVAVLVAYLCCQLRRWVALLCVAIFSGGQAMQAAVELAVTLPMLILLLRYAAPSVRRLSRDPLPMQMQFSLIPAVSYVFDYLTRVYTDWLVQGVPAAVEFMPFVCSAAYLVFVLHSVESLQRRHDLEQVQAVLDLQLKQSTGQIASLKKSQEQAAAQRHDQRHHLQYLSACIEHGALEQAQTYIHNLDDAITRQAMVQYCENTAANLVLSAFARRAEEAGVAMTVQAGISQHLHISESDLCVLLSNALENALNACAALRAGGQEASLALRAFQENGRVFLEIVNSCAERIVFANGLPVTGEKGHGIGVRSICAVVEKYSGMYSFAVENGRFSLRLSI